MLLATVVNVRGSAYRRPGARMLFSTKGREAGFVSAACLEADLFERVKEVFATGKPALFSYDTTAPEDTIFGIGQGCGGYVEILVELIGSKQSAKLLLLLQSANAQKEICALTTVFRTSDIKQLELGTQLFITNNDNTISVLKKTEMNKTLVADTQQALKLEQSAVKSYKLVNISAEVFIEILQPPIPLIIIGATPDVKPLVHIAVQIGWDVTVVDHRAAYAVKSDFLEAENVLLLHPEEYQKRLPVTSVTFAVIMIHQFEAELAALRFLLASSARYIGLLGPKSKGNLLLQHLASDGFTPSNEQIAKFHNPIGLDIGVESAEEIALSITSEIQAISKNRKAGFLKDRQGSIH